MPNRPSSPLAVRPLLRSGWTGLLDLVLPMSCMGCGAPGAAGCPQCLRDLCQAPGRTWPDPTPAGLPPVWAAADYAGVGRRLLLAFKEEGCRSLGPPLGAALAGSVAAALAGRAHPSAGPGAPGGRPAPGPWLVVPVPSRGGALRRRGYDHCRLLAEGAVRQLRRQGWPVRAAPALGYARRVVDQADLDADARAANLAAALRARNRPAPGAPGVVVVDDIVTTGATLAEAARALQSVGFPVCGAAVLMATRRLSASGPTAGAPP